MADAIDLVFSICSSALLCVPVLPFVIIFGLIFGVAAIGIYISLKNSRARSAALKTFALENGLVVSEGGWLSMPTLTGTYKGHQLQMGYFQRSEGSGKNRHTHTYFYSRLFTTSAPQFTLGISRESMFSWISKSIGTTNEIQIGVPDFDSKYIISTNNALRAKRVLSPEVRQKIDEMISGFGFYSFSIEAGSMYSQKETQFANPEELRRIAEAMDGLAVAIESY